MAKKKSPKRSDAPGYNKGPKQKPNPEPMFQEGPKKKDKKQQISNSFGTDSK